MKTNKTFENTNPLTSEKEYRDFYGLPTFKQEISFGHIDIVDNKKPMEDKPLIKLTL